MSRVQADYERRAAQPISTFRLIAPVINIVKH